MDRLTMHDAYDHGSLSFVKECEGRAVDMDMILDRLAAYEDTGLTPEEIEQLKGECFGWKTDAERYKTAESEGRLIVLPCKVGDTVYALKDTELFTQVAVPLRVQGISIDRNNRYKLHFGGYPFVSAEESAIGKRVFVSREEAEAALRRIDNGN